MRSTLFHDGWIEDLQVFSFYTASKLSQALVSVNALPPKVSDRPFKPTAINTKKTAKSTAVRVQVCIGTTHTTSSLYPRAAICCRNNPCSSCNILGIKVGPVKSIRSHQKMFTNPGYDQNWKIMVSQPASRMNSAGSSSGPYHSDEESRNKESTSSPSTIAVHSCKIESAFSTRNSK